MSTRRPTGLRRALYALLAVLFLVHNDFWQWNDARIVAGLPVGLTYHVAFCVVMALVMAAVVTWAWPKTDDGSRESDHERSETSF